MARLQRTLSLGSVVLFGIAYMTPICCPRRPLASSLQSTAGMVPAAYLAALVAMFFTAMSYGRMASAFPVAGSAYSYVRKAISPKLGFIAGWAVLLDYLVSADGDLADRRGVSQLRVSLPYRKLDLGAGVHRHHQHAINIVGLKLANGINALADAGAVFGADCLRRAVCALHRWRCEHAAVVDGKPFFNGRHADAADHERRGHRLLLVPRFRRGQHLDRRNPRPTPYHPTGDHADHA
jgi:putrescine importer